MTKNWTGTIPKEIKEEEDSIDYDIHYLNLVCLIKCMMNHILVDNDSYVIKISSLKTINTVQQVSIIIYNYCL